MLKPGYSTKLLQGQRLDHILERGAEIGYACAEIWMHQVWSSGISSKEIKDIAEGLGLTLQIHMDTSDINLTSNNEAIRQTSLDETLRAIDFAAEVGAGVVTVHPGRKTSNKDVTAPETLLERQIDAFRQLAERAEEKDVLIGAENMEARDLEIARTESYLKDILDAVNNDHLKTTLDIAHLQSIGDPLELTNSWSLPIANVHVSQAGERMHYPLFDEDNGKIAYAGIKSILKSKYDGFLIVEGYEKGKEDENLAKSYAWLEQFCN